MSALQLLGLALGVGLLGGAVIVGAVLLLGRRPEPAIPMTADRRRSLEAAAGSGDWRRP